MSADEIDPDAFRRIFRTVTGQFAAALNAVMPGLRSIMKYLRHGNRNKPVRRAMRPAARAAAARGKAARRAASGPPRLRVDGADYRRRRRARQRRA